jgi:hypothetical protein
LAQVWSGVASAEPALSFAGNPLFCPRLAGGESIVEKVEPHLVSGQLIPFKAPELRDPVEWKQLYFVAEPRHPEEVVAALQSGQWRDLFPAGGSPRDMWRKPGLIVTNARWWTEVEARCPNGLLADRRMTPGMPLDYIAPHLFDLYMADIQNSGQAVPLAVTYFNDRSPYFAGNYVSVVSYQHCPAERIYSDEVSATVRLELFTAAGRTFFALGERDPASLTVLGINPRPHGASDEFRRECLFQGVSSLAELQKADAMARKAEPSTFGGSR